MSATLNNIHLHYIKGNERFVVQLDNSTEMPPIPSPGERCLAYETDERGEVTYKFDGVVETVQHSYSHAKGANVLGYIVEITIK